MPITINTYNESSLHNTLKTLYSVTKNGRTEVNLNGYIYDIITDDEGIFEIQTKNLSKLLPKVMTTLEGGGKITVVYPIIAEKKVVLYDDDGNILSKRKSPKKQTIYSIFDELTGLTYLSSLNLHFKLSHFLSIYLNYNSLTELPNGVFSSLNRLSFFPLPFN